MRVRQWCQENGVNISSYYKWQRKVYAVAQAQQESRFVEVTPAQPVAVGSVAVTIRIAGVEADIHAIGLKPFYQNLYQTAFSPLWAQKDNEASWGLSENRQHAQAAGLLSLCRSIFP